jgi:cytochrome c oxidase subunit 2
MKVHVYEKAWIAATAVMLAAFAGAVVFSATVQGIHPPSQVETIDPTNVHGDGRFSALGVHETGDGVEVHLLAQIWAFVPGEVRVPRGRPVTFRITSPDLIHGFQIVGANVNATVVPGYVTQVTTTFPRAGEYLMLCNEYCGVGHHLMASKLIVEDVP